MAGSIPTAVPWDCLFIDIGGGIALAPSWTWIGDATGLPIIPEPGTLMLLAVGWVTVVFAGRSTRRRE